MHFRFRITQPDHSETFTDWQEEKVKYGEGASAVQAIKNVRRDHPDASIGIERIPDPNERGALGTIQVDVNKKSATVNLISPKPVKPE